MSTEFLWTIPTHGDGRDGDPTLRRRGDWNPNRQSQFASTVRDERPGNFTYYDYLAQIARAAEASGFDGLFVPYDPSGEESWTVATALAREAPRLRLLPEFQPGFATAVYTAKLAVSFQRFFDDRLGWKLALAGDAAVQRSVGDTVPEVDRVARADELLTVTKGAWLNGPFSFHGQHFEAVDTEFFGSHSGINLRPGHRIEPRRHPKIYLDGETEAALELSARHADVHLLASAEPTAVEQAITRHRAVAETQGRTVEYGIRLGVVARDSADEAWRKVDRLARSSGLTGLDEVQQQRIDDHLVFGFSRLGFSAPAGLVGSFTEVAQRLEGYIGLGVSSFILDGLPHLEEAYRLGERVLARVPADLSSAISA
jgi:alkanesulfonate monooxygenase